ncbi:MAG: hypothetical protein WD534_08570 [Phycisphaeraceae bacterium]
MTHRRHASVWLTATAVLIGTALLGGCQDPLFPKDTPRSPYERYQTLRGEQRQATDVRARGPAAGRPALRERLRPLDQY